MKPITRETIIDRRQPMLRWSAVFAGTAISVALWVLIQMLGMGGGLAAVDLDNAGSLRNVGIGTTIWTFAAPVVAMFIGSLIAGRLGTTYERRIGAVHGFVVWALTSVLGIVATARMVSMLTWHRELAENAQPLTQTELAHAAAASGRVLMCAGVSLLISLVGAVLGGAAGIGRRPSVETRTVQTPVVPPPSPIPPTEIG